MLARIIPPYVVTVENQQTNKCYELRTLHRQGSHQPEKSASFAMGPLTCGLWFHLGFEKFDIISMVDKSIPIENCSQFVNY